MTRILLVLLFFGCCCIRSVVPLLFTSQTTNGQLYTRMSPVLGLAHRDVAILLFCITLSCAYAKGWKGCKNLVPSFLYNWVLAEWQVRFYYKKLNPFSVLLSFVFAQTPNAHYEPLSNRVIMVHQVINLLNPLSAGIFNVFELIRGQSVT